MSNWINKILGNPEKTAPPAVAPKPLHEDSARNENGEGAVEANKRFIHNHWEEYPDFIQEHYKNTDLIQAYEREQYELERCIRVYANKMEEFIELTSKAQDAGFKLHGMQRILADYDNRILCATVKLNSIPPPGKLRIRNCELEAIAKENGWIVWNGTGGMHWNKKGVIEDGYGVYERK